MARKREAAKNAVRCPLPELVRGGHSVMGVSAAETARVLAGRFGRSPRQARGYVDQAAASGRVPVPATRQRKQLQAALANPMPRSPP